MKLILLAVAALVAVALAAPAEKEPPKILRSDFEQDPQGGYKYNFETEDGSNKEETGEVKEVLDEENKPQTVIIARGSYSYVDPDGKTHSFTYFADETGFHVEGEDVPKSP